MKKIYKCLAIFFAMLMAFSVCACSNGDSGNATKIIVRIYEGGAGYNWIWDAAERFAEANENVSFQDGKTGVVFDIKSLKNMETDLISSSTVDIYFASGDFSPRVNSQKGYLLDINDIVTEKIDVRNGVEYSIADKIIAGYEKNLINPNDGHYYGLPFYEIYSGLSYDVDAFNKGCWFAAPDASDTDKEAFTSKYGSASFLKGANGKKSCGVDGKYGTEDDGLPTSLEELLILCARVKTKGYMPFTVCGASYLNMLMSALWASVAGAEKISNLYEFKGQHEVLKINGEEDALYTSENLFAGIDYIKVPQTETITLTEKTGYDMSRTIERYYALSFLEIIHKENFLSKESSSSDYDNIATQLDFICNGVNGDSEKAAMIVEGNYWYNESGDYGNIDEYRYLVNDETAEKNVKWMPLPVQLKGTITEGNGKKLTFAEYGGAYAFINRKTETNKAKGIADACKEFLQFIYTDAELSAYTGRHGCTFCAIDYPLKEADELKISNGFYKSVNELKKNANVVYKIASNTTFLQSSSTLAIDGSKFNMIGYDGKHYSAILQALRTNATVKDLFDNSIIKQAKWADYYKA